LAHFGPELGRNGPGGGWYIEGWIENKVELESVPASSRVNWWVFTETIFFQKFGEDFYLASFFENASITHCNQTFCRFFLETAFFSSAPKEPWGDCHPPQVIFFINVWSKTGNIFFAPPERLFFKFQAIWAFSVKQIHQYLCSAI